MTVTALKAASFDERLLQEPLDVKTAADDDIRHWSVTTLIGVLDKPALIYWSANQTARAAVESWKTWTAMAKDTGPDEAIKWLSNARFRKPAGSTRTAAELGTAVHAAIETYTLSGTRPEVDAEIRPYLEQFDRWAQAFQPEYQAAEVTVYSPDRGYAGTCDAFLTIDGVRFIADYKTTRNAFEKDGTTPTRAYPEVALQLAAYRYAQLAAVWRPRRVEQFRRRYYLLGDTEREMAAPVPEVDTGLCIKITPEHCIAYPVLCGPNVFERFLHVVECARWKFELESQVIGNPLVPPAHTEVA